MQSRLDTSVLHRITYPACVLGALCSLAIWIWSLSALQMGQPYYGFELVTGGGVHEVDPEGPAYRAGIREQHEVRAIDGKALFGIVSLLAGREVEDRVEVEVVADGATRTTTLQLGLLSGHEYIITVERLVLGLIFWVVGTLVWMLRPAHPHIRLFFVFSQVMAAIMAMETLDPGIPGAVLVSDGLRIFMAPVALHFYASFPVPLQPSMRRVLLGVAYGGAVLLTLLNLTLLLPERVVASHQLWVLVRTFDAGVLVAALVVLLRRHRHASLDSKRRRRALIAGMVLGIFPTLILTLLPGLPFLLGAPLLGYVWTIPCVAFVPVVYAYAVYHGELGQIDLLLNRTVVYLMLTAVLLTSYVLVFVILTRTLGAGQAWMPLVSGAALVVVMSALFGPMRATLQKWVDRLFYGGWYDYRSLIHDISLGLSRASNRDQLLSQIGGAAEQMRYRGGVILWPEADAFVPASSFGVSVGTMAAMRLPAPGVLAKALTRWAYPLGPDVLRKRVDESALHAEERALLEAPDIRLWIPLVSHGVLRAVVLTSEHLDGEPISQEDVAILTTLARQAAVACENVSLLESLRERIEQVERLRREMAEIHERLAAGREAERLHIARELHDGPVQDLYALNHALESLGPASSEAFTERLGLVHHNIREIAATLREVCTQLRPPLLAEFGFEAALRAYAAQFEDKHRSLRVTLTLELARDVLPAAVHLPLFRICQEALANAAQHARARQVAVRLDGDGAGATLTVEDDGQGFDMPNRWIELGRHGHLGLLGIAERAEGIGGHLTVDSARGRGTRITVTFVPDAPSGTIAEPDPDGALVSVVMG